MQLFSVQEEILIRFSEYQMPRVGRVLIIQTAKTEFTAILFLLFAISICAIKYFNVREIAMQRCVMMEHMKPTPYIVMMGVLGFRAIQHVSWKTLGPLSNNRGVYGC